MKNITKSTNYLNMKYQQSTIYLNIISVINKLFKYEEYYTDISTNYLNMKNISKTTIRRYRISLKLIYKDKIFDVNTYMYKGRYLYTSVGIYQRQLVL